MDIQQWGEGILRDTDEKWRSLKDKYSFSASGFSVFYSPLRENPDLLILGYNPGGGADAFDEKKALTIPVEHDYFAKDYDYALARKMRTIFDAIDKRPLLENSVKLNLIFFRSANKNDFMSVDKGIRAEIDTFCFGKVKDVIGRLKPKIILTEGVQTFDILKNLLALADLKYAPPILGTKKRRIYCKAENDAMKIIGLLHLSGARPSEGELKSIEEALNGDLAGF